VPHAGPQPSPSQVPFAHGGVVRHRAGCVRNRQWSIWPRRPTVRLEACLGPRRGLPNLQRCPASHGSALIPDDNRGHPTQPSARRNTPGNLRRRRRRTGRRSFTVVLQQQRRYRGRRLLYSLAVYSGRKGTVHFLGLITPRHQPADVLPTLLTDVRMSSGMITVSEFWYRPRDGTCCPSGKSTTI
jgi:hypothetical protein